MIRQYTAYGVFLDKQHKRETAFTKRRTDGLLIRALKRLFGLDCWQWCYCCFVGHRCRRGIFNRKVEALTQFHSATDHFMVLSFAVVFILYCLSTLCWQDSDRLRLVAIAVGGYRLGNILSIYAQLHTSSNYETDAPQRAVANVMFQYLEITLTFAIFYDAIHYWMPCSFHVSDETATGTFQFHDAFTDSLYFSFVTITTLGYGDIKPLHSVAKLFVILEVFIGLVVLVTVVVPRALSAATTGKPDKSAVNRGFVRLRRLN